MVDWCFPAAWQFSLVVWLVDEVRVLVTMEVTFVVDLKCLSIVRWSVILPMCVFLLVCFILGQSFALEPLALLLPERTVFYTIHNVLIWS